MENETKIGIVKIINKSNNNNDDNNKNKNKANTITKKGSRMEL